MILHVKLTSRNRMHIRPFTFTAALYGVLLLCSSSCSRDSHSVKYADISRLNHACEVGDLNVVKEELPRPIEPDGSTTPSSYSSLINSLDGKLEGSAIHVAAANGHAEIVAALLDSGVKVDLRTNTGSTSLILAVKGQRTETAKLLIARGADVNAVDRESAGTSSILNDAVMFGNESLVTFLLDHGAKINPDIGAFGHGSPLCEAIISEHREIVRILLDRKAPVDTLCGGNRPLRLTKDVKVARLLVTHGMKPEFIDVCVAENLAVAAFLESNLDETGRLGLRAMGGSRGCRATASHK